MAEFVDQRRFHELAQRGEGRGVAVCRPATVVRANGDGRIVRWTFSDGSVDRMGDKLNPNGWELRAYRRCPVVLWAHNSMEPPIGRALNVFSDGMRLIGDIEFADGDTYDFADTVFRLVSTGFLKAGSVGFLPISFSWAKDPDRRGGIDFHEQELLEFSIVPVPALPSALIEGRGLGVPPLHLSRLVIGDAARRTAALKRSDVGTFQSVEPLAGCMIDHQRERARQEQRDRIHREIRCLHLGLKSVETPAARRSHLERLGRLYVQLDTF